MYKYSFPLLLLLFSFSLVAMDAPDPDDAPLMPLELKEKVTLPNGTTAYADYTSAVATDCNSETLSEEFKTVSQKFSDIQLTDKKVLGLAPLPNNRLLYAALTTYKTTRDSLWLVLIEGEKFDHVECSTPGTITSCQFFFNPHTKKIASQALVSLQETIVVIKNTILEWHTYRINEKYRIYVPYDEPLGVIELKNKARFKGVGQFPSQ